MTTAQVVETSVTVTNSSFQNYTHPDDHTTRTTDTPGFKPFTMKALAALLLLSAFAAYVSAEEMAFHKVVFQFLDERQDERMAQVLRDQGLPEDTLFASDHPEPPDWMVN